jgi:hypothetical protein
MGQQRLKWDGATVPYPSHHREIGCAARTRTEIFFAAPVAPIIEPTEERREKQKGVLCGLSVPSVSLCDAFSLVVLLSSASA